MFRILNFWVADSSSMSVFPITVPRHEVSWLKIFSFFALWSTFLSKKLGTSGSLIFALFFWRHNPQGSPHKKITYGGILYNNIVFWFLLSKTMSNSSLKLPFLVWVHATMTQIFCYSTFLVYGQAYKINKKKKIAKNLVYFKKNN